MPENYYSHTEINQRDRNEDGLDRSMFYVAGELITVLSVADGMGGHEHGEDVSREGLLKFNLTLFGELKAVDRLPPLTMEKLKQCLLNAIDHTNSHIKQMVQTNEWEKAGSTIVSAVIWRNRLLAVNLGDSPLFHYEAESGQLVKVTLDHSVPAILAQAGIITEEMARHHERRGQLEFFLGCPYMPDPLLVYERAIDSGDLLLLCSDGISGSLSLEQIQQVLARKNTSLAEKADLLIRVSRDAGETDNQTLIFWRHPGNSDADGLIESHSLTQEHEDIDLGQDPRMLYSSPSQIGSNHVPKNSSDLVRDNHKQHSIDRLINARNASWLLFGSVVTVAAVLWGISDPGLVKTLDVFKSLPRQLEELLPQEAPKASPTREYPKKSPKFIPKRLPKEPTNNQQIINNVHMEKINAVS